MPGANMRRLAAEARLATGLSAYESGHQMPRASTRVDIGDAITRDG